MKALKWKTLRYTLASPSKLQKIMKLPIAIPISVPVIRTLAPLLVGLSPLFISVPTLAKKFMIDPAHSSIEFSVKHLGIAPVKGRFKVFEGSFDFYEKTGVAKNLIVKMDVDSIDTNESNRDAHLRSKDFFHVRNDTYDIIEENRYLIFKAASTSIKSKEIAGRLKILKTTRPVVLTSQVRPLKNGANTERIGVQAEGMVNRQHFGLTWQKPSTGFLAKAAGKFVGDEVKIIIHALAKPEPEKKSKLKAKLKHN